MSDVQKEQALVALMSGDMHTLDYLFIEHVELGADPMFLDLILDRIRHLPLPDCAKKVICNGAWNSDSTVEYDNLKYILNILGAKAQTVVFNQACVLCFSCAAERNDIELFFSVRDIMQ